MHELVGNPRLWSVASFDHDHFTSAGGRKVLDTILKLCAPGTRRLEVNTRGMMARFPWAHFMKHLSRISSNLSHLSLLGFEVSSKHLDMVLSSCPALSHLRIELFPKKYFAFSRLTPSLKVLEFYVDDLSHLNVCARYYRFYSDVMTRVVTDWANSGCCPSQLIISHATPTEKYLSISDLVKSLFSDDIQPPPKAKGQLQVCLDCSLGIFPYFQVVIENSEVCVPETSCSSITSYSPLLLAESQTQCVCVTAEGPNSCKPLEKPFSVIAPALTHLILAQLYSDFTSDNLEEIAYNCPGLRFLCLKECSRALSDLSGLARVVEKCQRLEGLNVQGVTIDKQGAFFDILTRIRKLLHLAVDLTSLPVDDQKSRGRIWNLRSLEVTINAKNSNDYLSTLAQLIPTDLKVLLMEFSNDTSCQNEIDSGLRNLLSSLSNLKCLFLGSSLRTIAIPTDKRCYQSIEKVHLEVSEMSFGKDLIEALIYSGHLTHFYLSAYHISTDALNELLQTPRLKCCHVRLCNLYKLPAGRKKEFITKITDTTKARGILQSSVKSLSKKHRLMSNVHPDLRPLLMTIQH